VSSVLLPTVRSARTVPAASPAPAFTMPPAGGSGSLLKQLADALELRNVRYCQWKGHWSAHRWATGLGDIDLLVDHDQRPEFSRVVEELGFKVCLPSGTRQIAGIEHYLGHDPSVNRLLHLHVHYRLLMGDYWKPVYRLPIEAGLLENTVPGSPFRVPSPTHQYLVFVLRMLLRQVGRPHLSLQKTWTNGIRVPLESLDASSDREELGTILRKHLTPVDLRFFDRCVRSLQGSCGKVERAILPWELHQRLRAHVRRPSAGALLLAILEKSLPSFTTEWISDSRLRLNGSGVVIALVGGDGAGKSTCARELRAWLAPTLPAMRAHLGNPPKSFLTLLAGGALKVQQRLDRVMNRQCAPGGVLELARHVCTARDRYRLYVKVRRFALSGGVALCERYPIAQNRRLVGPCIPELLSGRPGKLAKLLCGMEARYYERILSPDAVLVLRLDPEIAVLRKPEEPADYVRARGQIIWNTDWSDTGAHVLDASQPLPDVLQRLKAIIWSRL
jgi:hypothetical protein